MSETKHGILVVVPKSDEYSGLERAFRLNGNKQTRKAGRSLYCSTDCAVPVVGGSATAPMTVALMGTQGNTKAYAFVEKAIDKYRPRLAVLFGTALGLKDRTVLGDVLVPDLVIDATEWVTEKGGEESCRTEHLPVCGEAIQDVERFVRDLSGSPDWAPSCRGLIGELVAAQSEVKRLVRSDYPIRVKAVAAMDDLTKSASTSARVKWLSSDKRIFGLDMESAGFARACADSSNLHWLVVRVVSDHGTATTKKDVYRLAAALVGAGFLKRFLAEGLNYTHPLSSNVAEIDAHTLSAGNFFVQTDITAFLVSEIRSGLGIDLAGREPGPAISAEDLISICVARGAEQERAADVVESIREDYFTRKYTDYTYKDDLRGFCPDWADEPRAMLRRYGILDVGRAVLDVGVGNGLELPALFPPAEDTQVTGVDVSAQMLERAEERYQKAHYFRSSAEDLSTVQSGSMDAYVSLRTYQSSLFGIRSALRQAYRVLRPNGVLVISVANGYIDTVDEKKVIVRGLIMPGTRTAVAAETPMRIAESILFDLQSFGFTDLEYHLGRTDIYVTGMKS